MKASLFLYFWLCWVFVSVRGLSPVAASGGHSSSGCTGLSLSRPLLLRSTGSRCAGSVVVAHGLSCPAACGILPDQGSNPCPLHWQADSQPLRHQGSPENNIFKECTWFSLKPKGKIYSPYLPFVSKLPSISIFLIQEVVWKGQHITIVLYMLCPARALECWGPFLLAIFQKSFWGYHPFIHAFIFQQICIDLQLCFMFCAGDIAVNRKDKVCLALKKFNFNQGNPQQA